MKIVLIKSEADYDAALEEIDRLMDAEPNTRRGDRLDVLVTLVDAYEAKRWAIEPPAPIDAIKLRMNSDASAVATWSAFSADAVASRRS